MGMALRRLLGLAMLALSALLVAAPPAKAVEERVWEWSLTAGINPASSDGRVFLVHPVVLPEAVPGSDIGYELTYGSSRAAIGSAVRYQFAPRWRIEMDFSMLSLPLDGVRTTSEGSGALLEASADSFWRWGGLSPTTLTHAHVMSGNSGLAASIHNALWEQAGSPTDPALIEPILRRAIVTAADIPLEEELFVSQSHEGDLIQLSLLLNIYYDILSVYPYAIYIGAGAGVFWSRLDDPSVRVSHRVVSQGAVQALNDRPYRIAFGIGEIDLPDLEETRTAIGFYAGTRQYFSEKSAMNARLAYYLFEASDNRADTGETDELSVRIGIDFLF